MKILTAKQTREADKYTIENEPIRSEELMERAASKCADWILQNCSYKSKIFIFSGPGNNGGDGLVIARLLSYTGFSISVILPKISTDYSNDFQTNYNKIIDNKKITVLKINSTEQIPEIKENDIIVDALFGSGLTRSLTGFAAEIIEYLNNIAGTKIAIDIPSGLFGENNPEDNKTIFKADYTLTFEFPFLSFMFPENNCYVGQYVVLPIGLHPEFIQNIHTPYQLITDNLIKSFVKSRKKFAHKGNFGHGLLIAGDHGTIGAAILSAKAAHRAGIGLLTAFLPEEREIAIHIASPETMIYRKCSPENFKNDEDFKKFTGIAIGPGFGVYEYQEQVLKTIIQKFKQPIVFDADAINILSQNKNLLKDIPENSVFTPHLKEFERLTGSCDNHFERIRKQMEFSETYRCFVILKGANTCITTPDKEFWFNITGNPGMATGGSGDVLTGILLGLLAQKKSVKECCLTAVYLHGLAADLAASEKSEEALIAGDIIDYLPKAFLKILNI